MRFNMHFTKASARTGAPNLLLARAVAMGLALSAAVSFVAPVHAQNKAPGVQVGVLKCKVEQGTNFIVGSTKTLECVYKPANKQPAENYAGTVSEYGLDIGSTSDTELVWGVLAPSADMKPGALAGEYAGVAAGASLGAGIQANALIGGLDRSIALNPFSLQSETGTNLTLGVSQLSLKYNK